MRYCFDIDGVLCNDTKGDYTKAVPNHGIIRRIAKLHGRGHTIILYTARGATTGVDWLLLTEEQLKRWNVRYNELVMGKPGADVYIDDKCIKVSEWLEELDENSR